ncbi:leucocin A/sakacin P family class II bacteriocin [Streptococcus dentasini]
MTTQTLEQFDAMTAQELAAIEGGATVEDDGSTYYGNGLYCSEDKGCWVDTGRLITSLVNNIPAQWFTGGKSGWNSNY